MSNKPEVIKNGSWFSFEAGTWVRAEVDQPLIPTALFKGTQSASQTQIAFPHTVMESAVKSQTYLQQPHRALEAKGFRSALPSQHRYSLEESDDLGQLGYPGQCFPPHSSLLILPKSSAESEINPSIPLHRSRNNLVDSNYKQWLATKSNQNMWTLIFLQTYRRGRTVVGTHYIQGGFHLFFKQCVNHGGKGRGTQAPPFKTCFVLAPPTGLQHPSTLLESFAWPCLWQGAYLQKHPCLEQMDRLSQKGSQRE